MATTPDEVREGVALTHLDQPLFDGAGATKRDLVDHLDALSDRLIGVLAGRPLSVVRTRAGQEPFMQKNLPRHAPATIPRTTVWSEASHREVTYALCDDRPTLIWFGNQRAVEYHVPLATAADPGTPTHLVLDLDPPAGADFTTVVAAARLVRTVLSDAGLTAAVKTSGSKGLHVVTALEPGQDPGDAFAATRAVAARAARLDPALATTAFLKDDRGGRVYLDPTRAGGATLAAAYAPRARPGTPVSFPVRWSELDAVTPADFTVHTAAGLLGDADPWSAALATPHRLPADLVAEGHDIPVPRVAAMHEGKRRKRARERGDA